MRGREESARWPWAKPARYLLLTQVTYNEPGFGGAKFVCSSPLRTEQDQEQLWMSLRQGELHVVATDHCSFNLEGQKDNGHLPLLLRIIFSRYVVMIWSVYEQG